MHLRIQNYFPHLRACHELGSSSIIYHQGWAHAYLWQPVCPYHISTDATDRYTEDLDSFDDLHTHLTNIAINKDRVHVFENVREKDLPTEGLRL